MRKNMLFSIAISAVLFMGLGSNAFAQQPATAAPTGCITVVEGDNLWTLDNNFNIQALAAKSPDLKPALDAADRRFTTRFNQLGIRIEPGEVICGVEREGVQLVPLRPTPAVASTPVPAQVQSAQSDPSLRSKSAQTVIAILDGTLLLIILAVAAIVLLIWILRRRNPAGSPERRFVPEGVQPEAAHAHAATLAPMTHPGRPFVIISQTRQRARGAVISEYLNPTRLETVVLDGGPNSYVYRTRLRFTDVSPNEEAEMPFLAACGNPIRYGQIGRYIPGIRFEYLGDAEIIPEPTPVPVIEPVAEPVTVSVEPAPAPVSEPQPQPEPVPAAVVKESATNLAGIEVSVDGDNPSFKMTRLDGSIVLELAVSSGAQFMLTVPAASVKYANGCFSFDASGLPAGLTVPVSAEVIAAAAVRQLTAPAEKPEQEKPSVEAHKSQTA